MNCFHKRRLELLKKIPEHSLIVLSSGCHAPIDTMMEYPYFVNHNFYYLTGISQENCFLILLKEKGYHETLFINPFDAHKEKWIGHQLNIEESQLLSDIKNTKLNDEILITIKKALIGIKNIYLDFHHNAQSILHLENVFKKYHISDIYSTIAEMRMIKDPIEIKMINEAIKITHLGLMRIIKELKTAHYEYEIYNAFNHEILNHGTHEIAFPTIVANEVNACCLHYPSPLAKLKPNSLILCDLGASYHHYCADITRTYPINGRFSKRQKEIYEIVLSCNKSIINYVRPGLSISTLQTYAKEYLANACLKAKLIKKKEDIVNYYYHGISHLLGLRVHDVTKGNETILRPGMVLTVEPGLYIKEEKIGIRIEDDVLITKTGAICLSKDIKKEIKDIEKLFGGKK